MSTLTEPRTPGQADTPAEAAPVVATSWRRDVVRRAVVVDLALLVVAVAAAYLLRFGGAGDAGDVAHLAAGVALVLGWSATLALSRCYEPRFLGAGSEEFRRVTAASLHTAGVATFLVYAMRLPLARGFVIGAVLGGTLLLFAGRAVCRASLRAQHRRGVAVRRVVVVGTPARVRELTAALHRDPSNGYRVVGACVPGGRGYRTAPQGVADVPVLGPLASLADAVRRERADTVAVTASQGVNGDALRQLSYELEGTDVDLLVAPTLTDVSGTRISIRPVSGLPLLHVDEPELAGARRLVKAGFDRSVSLVALALLAPLLVALALAVRLTSAGPALFRQTRVGRDGTTFTLLKLRTMHVDAEARLAELAHLNEHDGPLFKVRDDPRVTPLGRFLRAWSLDELPQLLNVLLGDMSLVGPRPPLPSEVAQYAGHTRRRLLVKPGLTGLWQVSGRSNLSWDESVRLDLQYVENWSLLMDIVILLRTVGAVAQRHGAY